MEGGADPADHEEPDTPTGNYCTVMYDFPGTNDGELAVTARERLTVIENDGSGWVLCDKVGVQGYVPDSYIEFDAK